MFNNKRKLFISGGFISNLILMFGGINLYLNDKLKADLQKIIGENNLKNYLKEAHNRSAKTYDYRTGRIEIRNQINKYRRILTSYSQGKILETGCGTGINFVYYKECDDVTAIDYSDRMIEIANKKLETKQNQDNSEYIVKCNNIKINKLDCENLKDNFLENSFDTVIDINNFQSYYDYFKVIDNIKYVLKDKGKLIVLCRGESNNIIISQFYKIFYYTTMMKYGNNFTINWDKVFLNDKDFRCLYNNRKNLGKTYLYVLELNKEH